MRILVAEFSHESNAFCAGLTGFAAFDERERLEGAAVLERHAEMHTVLGGFCAVAQISRTRARAGARGDRAAFRPGGCRDVRLGA